MSQHNVLTINIIWIMQIFIQWKPLAIDILLHQRFHQLRTTFVSSMPVKLLTKVVVS